MWRRLIREDLAGSNPLVEEKRRLYEFVWYRWESGYQLVEQGGQEPYFEALHADEPSNILSYMPLVATPHLFLEFARLQERKDVDEAVYDWIHDYGLLGLNREEPVRHDDDAPLLVAVRLHPLWGMYWQDPQGTFRKQYPLMLDFVGEYSTAGGPEETLVAFRTEVRVANRVLSWYEAALSKDVDKLEQALQLEGAASGARRRREHFRKMAKHHGITYTEALVDVALDFVFWDVQQVLEAFTYPCLAQHSSSGRPPFTEPWTPERMRASLWPRNLLGAMYLQFFWLITSAGELSRCKQCGHIISRAPARPGSGDRKPRKDKEFCDSRCRQNYHYQNRVKPRRRGS